GAVFVHLLHFPPDGRGLFAVISDEGLCLFDPRTGERLDVSAITSDGANAVFSPDARRLCLLCGKSAPTAGGSELELRLLCLARGKLVWTADLPGMAALVAMDYSADGRLIAAGKQAGSVHLFDAASGAHRGRCGPEKSGEVRSMALSADGGTVVWCAATQLYV